VRFSLYDGSCKKKALRKRRVPSKGGNILDYVLKAEALTKIYGHHRALDNFSPNVAEVYNRINISRLTAALEKHQCEVLSIQEREENLESYYVDLIGGIRHE